MTPDSANARHYDIIIGSGAGAGGGTLAHSLAASGKRILLIERGDFLRREQDNWNPQAVFVQAVVSCGAINSAALLLRSASPQHPDGLANSSGVVGRHYMRHNNSAFMAISRTRNDTVFQKTPAINDYYARAPDWDYPLGHIQMLGKSHGGTIKGELPAWLPFKPDFLLAEVAHHAIAFWRRGQSLADGDRQRAAGGRPLARADGHRAAGRRRARQRRRAGISMNSPITDRDRP